MTDIVERLRKENSCPPYYSVPKIQAEAADEIERLRAALETIGRMKTVPDDVMNRVTLMAVLRIARGALTATPAPKKEDE